MKTNRPLKYIYILCIWLEEFPFVFIFIFLDPAFLFILIFWNVLCNQKPSKLCSYFSCINNNGTLVWKTTTITSNRIEAIEGKYICTCSLESFKLSSRVIYYLSINFETYISIFAHSYSLIDLTEFSVIYGMSRAVYFLQNWSIKIKEEKS